MHYSPPFQLEAGPIPNNIRYLSNGREKLVCFRKIELYGFFTTVYVYKLYFYAFTKDSAFLLNSTDIQSKDTLYSLTF